MKIGDKVKCINNNGLNIGLTIDKEYEVRHVYGNLIGVRDDKGGDQAYTLYEASRFREKTILDQQGLPRVRTT